MAIRLGGAFYHQDGTCLVACPSLVDIRMMVEDRAVTCVALGGTLDMDGPGDILDADVVSTCPVGNEEGTCDEAMVHPFCDQETL